MPLPTKFIIWLEATGNYTWVNLTNRQSYLITHTLKWFEIQLTQFVRINKSALVNPSYISAFERLSSKQAHIVLSTGLALSVSRRRVEPVTVQLDLHADKISD